MVIATTTPGDTMVELQLFEWTLFMKRKFNTFGSIVQFTGHLGFHTCFIVRCTIYQALDQLTYIPSEANRVVSILDKGYIGAQAVYLSKI